jgi:hypothetical protein
MKKLINSIVPLTAISLAVACGGGGGSGGTTADSTEAITGVFQDAEVEGLSFSTTGASGLSGITDAGGNFQYRIGEEVTFKIGDVQIGKKTLTIADNILTPIELVSADVGSTVNSGNMTVQNILVFLQSLDDDGNPENGIAIKEAIRNEFMSKSLNFKIPEAAFSTELDGKLPTGKTRKSHEAARAHFDANLNDINNAKDGNASKAYKFERDGSSTVSYSGQTARQLLIDAVKTYTSGLTYSANSHDTVLARLTKLYTSKIHSDETLTASDQTNIDGISTSKNLQAKTAGNDASTDHKNWTAGNTFRGWLDADIALGGGNIKTPEGLIWAFLNKLADQTGVENRVDIQNNPISKVYITDKRQDLNQLIQKFLWAAVNYSQATDDYFGNDIAGKGLLAGNALKSGTNYTNAEHSWDEGFGYFGAAVNFNKYSDREIAGKTGRPEFANGRHDYDGSGNIDLKSEKLYSYAIYAGKRDIDDSNAQLDLTRSAFNALLKGRTILAEAGLSALTASQTTALTAQRDVAVSYWEKIVLSSAAYYINKTLADIETLKTSPTDDTALNDYAKHWSELKGFALGLQFNPQSNVSDANFVQLHGLIGDSPELESVRFDAYIAKLEDARTILLNAAGTTAKGVFGLTSKLTATTTTSVIAPNTYAFSRDSSSSVSYTGQVARQALIEKIKTYTSSLTGTETATEVLTRLTKLYASSEHGDEALSSTNYTISQGNINDISTNKNLKGKTAGNDSSTDHKVWTNGNTFKGWSDTSIQIAGASVSGNGSANISTPEGLIWSFFHQLAEQSSNTTRVDAFGSNVTKAYVTTKRQDLNQLIEKFMWGAINYSQATDDYFSSDISGKGLLAGNTISSGKNYSSLEHAWDEAFGYFGASRDYIVYTDKEIAGKSLSTDAVHRSSYAHQAFDSDQDGKIDYASEKLFAHSIYAGKRDLDKTTSGVDLTKDTFDAFKLGRAIIAAAEGKELTSTQMSELAGQRNLAVGNWEKIILASTAYYVNETLDDITDLENSDISNQDTVRNNYAKHWSELKGFALSLQFNPQSRVRREQFVNLHELIGDAPELDTSKLNDYVTSLKKARDLVLGVAGTSIQSALNAEFETSGATIGTEAAGDND